MTKTKLGNNLAQIFSYLFNPLLMTTFAVVIFFNSGHFFSVVNYDIKNTIYFLFFILTFLSPALFIPMMHYLRLGAKREISDKTIKIITMVIIVILYSIVYYYMKRISMPPILLNILLSYIILTIFCSIVIMFWNISIYTSGIGGLLGFSLYLAIEIKLPVLSICFLLILISGIIATSRLYLNKHNPLQVYTGFFLGLITVYLCMLIF